MDNGTYRFSFWLADLLDAEVIKNTDRSVKSLLGTMEEALAKRTADLTEKEEIDEHSTHDIVTGRLLVCGE